MKLSRVCALILSSFTALFALVAWLVAALDDLTLALLAVAAIIVFVPGLGRSRSSARRWLMVVASSTYSFLALAALGLQFEQEVPLVARSALSAFLLLGLALTLRCAHQLNRTTRYGFHNYYDGPR